MIPDIIYFAGLGGTLVFAISGALAAAENELDILGFILFATVTGIGGGTVRDLILGVEVAWAHGEHAYDLHICVAAAVVTYFLAPQFIKRMRLLVWMDAMGLAIFSAVGTAKAYELGLSPLVCIAMGMITPTFGSMIRDILSDRQPELLQPEIYVTASIVGGVCFILSEQVLTNPQLSILLAALSAFLVRSAAIVYNLRLPKFTNK